MYISPFLTSLHGFDIMCCRICCSVRSSACWEVALRISMKANECRKGKLWNFLERRRALCSTRGFNQFFHSGKLTEFDKEYSPLKKFECRRGSDIPVQLDPCAFGARLPAAKHYVSPLDTGMWVLSVHHPAALKYMYTSNQLYYTRTRSMQAHATFASTRLVQRGSAVYQRYGSSHLFRSRFSWLQSANLT